MPYIHDPNIVPTIVARWLFVTPAMATNFLAHHNPNNRPLSMATSMKYRDYMLDGEWLLNGETISISTAGNLLNAQHRMKGVELAGKKDPTFQGIWFLVAENVDSVAFSSYDNGRKRSAGDVMHILTNLGATWSREVSTALGLISNYYKLAANSQAIKTETDRWNGLKKDQVPAFLEQYKVVVDPARTGAYKRMSEGDMDITGSHLVALHYLFSEASDPETAEKFFRSFQMGLDDPGFNAVHPVIKTLKNQWIKASTGKNGKKAKGVGRVEGLVWLVEAWNAIQTGQLPARFSFNPNKPFPRIRLAGGQATLG